MREVLKQKISCDSIYIRFNKRQNSRWWKVRLKITSGKKERKKFKNWGRLGRMSGVFWVPVVIFSLAPVLLMWVYSLTKSILFRHAVYKHNILQKQLRKEETDNNFILFNIRIYLSHCVVRNKETIWAKKKKNTKAFPGKHSQDIEINIPAPGEAWMSTGHTTGRAGPLSTPALTSLRPQRSVRETLLWHK